jgi:hypothetical protein
MARPVEWTDELKSALLDDFINYVEEQDIPIIAEFCAKHHVYKQRLYEWAEFADSIKWCITKKEGALESMGLTKQIDTTMAIFSLKQLGWKDKTEVEHSGSVTIVDDIPRK